MMTGMTLNTTGNFQVITVCQSKDLDQDQDSSGPKNRY